MANVKTIKWTEEVRLQLLEAVIKVEERIVARRRGSRGSTRHTLKWKEIVALLPDELVERRQNGGLEVRNVGKCKTVLSGLLKSYRDKEAGKNTVEARLVLTEPVRRMLKRFDDLVSGRCPVPERRSSSLDDGSSDHENDGNSTSAEQSEEETAESSHHSAAELQNTVVVPAKSIYAEEHEQKSSKCTATESLRSEGYADILNGLMFPSSADAPPANRCQSESQSRGHPHVSRSRGNRRQSGTQSRADPHVSRSRVSAEPPSGSPSHPRSESRAHTHESLSGASAKSLSRSEAHRTDQSRSSTKRPATDQEHLEAMIMERSRRSLDREYSRLSSWVQNQVIPVWRSVSNDIISSKIGSKRMKSSAPQSDTVAKRFDPFFRKSVEKIVDNQVRSSFQKLRTKLLTDLTGMSENVAKNILQETDFLNNR